MNQKKINTKTIKTGILYLIFFLICLILLFPIVFVIWNSFISPAEISRWYQELRNGTEAHLLFSFRFSLEGYYQVLLRRPDYLIKFWNSLLLCGAILAGQLIVSIFGGYAFAKFSFPGRKLLFFSMILLMMMPVQVTLVPNYIVLNKLGLIGSWWSLILPAVFTPFGTFLMTQIFRGIPDEVLESASLDGASRIRILWDILVPLGKGGIVSLVILSFIDSWNMVEQPLIYLERIEQYPLSVFLASTGTENFPLSFSCGVLALLPVLFLFLFFNEELISGIEYSGIR